MLEIFLPYAIWLAVTGRPFFWYRARPVATRPVIIESTWCRFAGGVYLIRILLAWLLPSLPPEVDILLWVCSAVLLTIGIFDSLRKRTEVL